MIKKRYGMVVLPIRGVPYHTLLSVVRYYGSVPYHTFVKKEVPLHLFDILDKFHLLLLSRTPFQYNNQRISVQVGR